MAYEIAVHVFNISDPRIEACYQQDRMWSPEQLGVAGHSVYDRTPVENVIERILHSVGNSKIRVFRTLAHGDSGGYQFPGLWTETYIALEYKKLSRHFAANARWELHGCGVASDTSILKDGVDPRDANPSNTLPGTFSSTGKGLRYLRRLATVFGVQVVAGINLQHSSPNDWSFEGDTVTVYPNGKFRYDSEGTRGWDFEAQNRAAAQYLNRIVGEIEDGSLARARKDLEDLVKKYPKSPAAAKARERLKKSDLGRLERSPDGSSFL